MSNEPPTSGPQPPEDDPFRKRPQGPEGAGASPPPPPGGGGPYGGSPYGGGGGEGQGGPYGGGGPYGPGGSGGPEGPGGPGGPGGPWSGGPPPYGGGPYGYGGADPLAGMPPLAPVGRRILARLIDWLIVAVPLALIGIPFDIYRRVSEEDVADVWAASSTGQVVFQLITIVAYVGYDTVLTRRNGQTLGKRLMGLRVAMLNDGRVPDTNASLIRAVVLWLPALICCACLWPLLLLVLILVDKPYKQGLHDKAAKTVVVVTTP
ncbi:RDD family protein [Streptomyces lichenis]|uniref:RDD family protein n=1 Tax=Streptomyces lichenis TaxID=2306967 RepID=A0ABT0I5R0_9ACTN|nr:RDD family protein [Streptomyces lichenis]MCK8676657.1 RDD family protein [Streptomyces lichenis]